MANLLDHDPRRTSIRERPAQEEEDLDGLSLIQECRYRMQEISITRCSQHEIRFPEVNECIYHRSQLRAWESEYSGSAVVSVTSRYVQSLDSRPNDTPTIRRNKGQGKSRTAMSKKETNHPTPSKEVVID
jgi:hypothetical protein